MLFSMKYRSILVTAGFFCSQKLNFFRQCRRIYTNRFPAAVAIYYMTDVRKQTEYCTGLARRRYQRFVFYYKQSSKINSINNDGTDWNTHSIIVIDSMMTVFQTDTRFGYLSLFVRMMTDDYVPISIIVMAMSCQYI